MIQTSAGTTINCEALLEQLNDKLIQQTSFDSHSQINCYQEDDWLVILITPQPTEDISIIVNVIKDTINESQIVNDFLIINSDNNNEIYFASDDDYPASLLNNQPQKKSSEKKYSSANFSTAFIIFIFSLLSITAIGIIYYLSRPCVIGECDLITTTNSSVSSLLETKSNDNLTESEMEDLKSGLITAIQKLKRIPRWSKSHQEATKLITDYQNQITDINYFFSASSIANQAKNMSQDLPLSLNEWTRVKTFWQDAIAQLKLISSSNFQEAKQKKIDNYQNIISEVETRIDAEKIGQEKLAKAQTIVTKIKENESAINSLSDLENLEKQWQKAIQEIESIPQDTVSAKNKDDLLNSYLTNISNVQGKLKAEKEASNLLSLAQENIKLAEESQDNNQWTKAVGFWEKPLNSLDKISPDSFVQEDTKNLKNITKQKLEQAKKSLKEAILREKIKKELKTICSGTENICSYNVSKKKINIFLSKDYFDKIISLSNFDNNSTKKQLLLKHIEQVENNYQYLSNKYKLPVEIYNFDQKLIMIYK